MSNLDNRLLDFFNGKPLDDAEAMPRVINEAIQTYHVTQWKAYEYFFAARDLRDLRGSELLDGGNGSEANLVHPRSLLRVLRSKEK